MNDESFLTFFTFFDADGDQALGEAGIPGVRDQGPLRANSDDDAVDSVGVARRPLDSHERLGLGCATEPVAFLALDVVMPRILAERRPSALLIWWAACPVRWMQEVRRYKPSTVSRRLSVVAGFYRTCVFDGVLENSPADYVRRPSVPAESPTLGLSHLQFEAMLSAARDSENRYDFALVAMLGLLGLRIFEATGCSIEDLGEVHGHRVLRVLGKGGKVVLTPLPPAVGRAIDRAVAERERGSILLNTIGTRMDRHAATRRLRQLAAEAGVALPRMHPHMLRHTFVTTMLDAGVDLRDVQIAARHADPRTTMRYDRARKNLDRHPNYILAAYMSSGT